VLLVPSVMPAILTLLSLQITPLKKPRIDVVM
jgi:hypothetical protein